MCGLLTCSLAKSTFFFIIFFLTLGSYLVPFSPLYLKQYWAAQSDTDVPWAWSLSLISSEIFTIHKTVYLIYHQLSSCGHIMGCSSPMYHRFLDNMSSCSYRTIKLLGNVLIAFTFNMLVYHFLSNLQRQLFPSLHLFHVECGIL